MSTADPRPAGRRARAQRLRLAAADPAGTGMAPRLGTMDYAFRALSVAGGLLIAALAAQLIAVPGATGLAGQEPFLRIWLGLVVGPLVLFIGSLVTWRVPGNACGPILILAALGAVAMQFHIDPDAPQAVVLMAEAVLLFAAGLVAPSLGYLMLVFPTGRVSPAGWAAPMAAAGGLKLAGVLLEMMASPREIRNLPLEANPLFVPALLPYRPFIAATIGITGLLLPMIVMAGLIALTLRYRASTPAEKQQIKWVLWGFGLFAPAVMLALGMIFSFGSASVQFRIALMLTTATQLLFLTSISLAILRYRLFDIDIIIRRTLVYGTLTVLVVATYVLAVGYLGRLFEARGSFALSLLATGLIAVLFQPLRERVQRTVNRLLYGERDDPYTVLSRLGERLEAALAPEAVLPALVETIAQTLKLPYVAVALQPAGESRLATAAAWGRPASEPMRLPLSHQSEPVGELLIAPRGPGETFSPAEQRLLGDIAHQAGVVVHAVRLTADLQRSRERLVAAREEERRRLRRDLHDGLGPTLASQTLTLTAARQLLRPDPDQAEALLTEAIRHAQAAVSDIRQLVYDLRPPALDDLGLAGALRAQAAEYGASGVDFQLCLPEALPPLPAAVEVACYRIAQEALTNVVKHAQAGRCTLSLAVEGRLALEVADDGRGLPLDARAGVGLASMRERAAELGGQCHIQPNPAGGTLVLLSLPLG